MGLDQEILRGKHNHPPVLNQETGEWIGAKTLISFRKSYWLHNRIMNTARDKGFEEKDLNCELIPLTKQELQEILSNTKECIKAESINLIDSYFDYAPINEHEMDWVIDEMKEFNMVLSRYLKNENLTEYFYWSWW